MSSPSFVVRKEDIWWVVRLSHEGMGEMPVGPRLAKGTDFPRQIGTSFESQQDAEDAAEKWTEWYMSQPYLKKKRKAKYIA